jgi:transaldolase
MEDIALFADFDAVCLSTFQLDRFEHNIARYAPAEKPNQVVLLRAKQVRYPAGLLCEDGRFLKRLSRDSRNMIQSILAEEVDRLSGAMDSIEEAVTLELDKHLEINGFKKLSPEKQSEEPGPPSSTVRVAASSALVQGDADPAWFKLEPVMQNVDDVF